MTADNPELKKLDMEIQITREVLDDLLMGQFPDSLHKGDSGGQLPEIFKPFRQLPELA